MTSINAQLEVAVTNMMLGDPAPTAAFVDIPDANGNVPEHTPTNFAFPAGFPNPPPPRPLRGLQGARFILAQCGCDEAQIGALVAQGFTTPERFQLFNDSSIDNLVNNLYRAPAADGGCKIPAANVIMLKSAVSWINEQLGYGIDNIDAYALHIPQLLTWNSAMRVHRGSGASQQNLVERPGTFDPVRWVSWKDGFVNYLTNVTGLNGVPLAYVIRDNIAKADGTPFSLSTTRIQSQMHSGPAFHEDNLTVYSLLHQALLNSEGWTHIAEHETTKDGKAAFATLCYHYDGPSAISNRIAWAKKEIATARYKSEATFSLDKYGTRLANAFRILRQNGQGKSAGDEVDIYLAQIESNNPIIANAISVMRYQGDCDTDFTKARAKLQEMVAKLRPAMQTAPQGTPAARKVSQVTQAKKKQKEKSGGASGTTVADIVRKDGKEFFNGVDITDRGRTFSAKEFRKIGPIFKEYILPNRPPPTKTSTVSAVEKQKKSNGDKFGTNQYE